MAEHQDLGRRLDRRDFFRLGLVAGPAGLLAACEWDGGPPGSELGPVSRVDDRVGERSFVSASVRAPTRPTTRLTSRPTAGPPGRPAGSRGATRSPTIAPRCR